MVVLKLLDVVVEKTDGVYPLSDAWKTSHSHHVAGTSTYHRFFSVRSNALLDVLTLLERLLPLDDLGDTLNKDVAQVDLGGSQAVGVRTLKHH